jgi:methanogenic corrinoid protein MtbC1
MTGPTGRKDRPARRLAEISAAVEKLEEKTVLGLVREAIAEGSPSMDIVRAVEDGMRQVGQRYERQDIYLSGLIMAGEIFRGVMELAPPECADARVGKAWGRVLLGTVAGDIHDIGKNLADQAFRIFGFMVEDLGVNVPPEEFFEAARRVEPDIVGLSGLLTVAFTSMRDTTALFRERARDLKKTPLIIIGGGTIDEHVAGYVAADLWTTDAMEGVRMCQRTLTSRKEK